MGATFAYTPQTMRDFTATDGQQTLVTRDLYAVTAAYAFIKQFQPAKGTIVTVTGDTAEGRWKAGYRRLRHVGIAIVLYDVD